MNNNLNEELLEKARAFSDTRILNTLDQAHNFLRKM